MEKTRPPADDEYLKSLDSLARFYNSQTTAHVGYQISVSAFALGTAVAVATSVFLRTQTYEYTLGNIVILDQYVRWGIPSLSFLLLVAWGLLKSAYSLKFLIGRTQYYVVLSWIVFEHMGLLGGKDPDRAKTLKSRMERLGVERAIRSLFEARLFVSRCRENRRTTEADMSWQEADYWRSMMTDKKKMKDFDVEESEIRFVEPSPNFDTVVLGPKTLGFVQRELLFISYHDYPTNERKKNMKEAFQGPYAPRP